MVEPLEIVKGGFRIELLDEERGEDYDRFLLTDRDSLIYSSNRFRKLLREFLKAEDRYLVATAPDGRILGVLPAFLWSGPNGPVLNSLPFYGSNGAVVTGDPAVKAALLRRFQQLAVECEAVATTIVTSPFETDLGAYEELTGFTHRDSRIGQLTRMTDAQEMTSEALLELYHSKTRNLVRKGQKSGFVVTHEFRPEYLRFLAETHEHNMNRIGGIAKPRKFFDLVPRHLRYGADYKVYVALKDGVPVSAVLLLYFNGTVEYYTPVIVEEFRPLQPLSLLIHEAMLDALKDGYLWWNWGGTWGTQHGVYHFKSRWGTVDKPYHYFTVVKDPAILGCAKDALVRDYPYFYVAPFGALTAASPT